MVRSEGTRLGWGIAGYGWVARDYVAPAITGSANGRLVAICDPDPAARAAADGLPGVLVWPDLASMLAQGDVDVVYVATPNHLHPPLVAAAAAAGKHVLCEKPMAADLAGAEAMAAACRAARVRYATAFDQRYHPAHQRLRELLADGAIGTVTAVRLVYACWVGADWAADNWRVDATRAGGGAMIDLAPHGLDLIAHLLGEPVIEATAMGQSRVQRYAVEDAAMILGRTASGVLAQMHVAYNYPEILPRRRLELIGTRGQLTATDTMGQTAGGRLVLTDAATGEGRDVAFDRERSPFVGLVEAFAAGVLAGRRDVADGELRAMRLIERLKSDLRKGAVPCP